MVFWVWMMLTLRTHRSFTRQLRLPKTRLSVRRMLSTDDVPIVSFLKLV